LLLPLFRAVCLIATAISRLRPACKLLISAIITSVPSKARKGRGESGIEPF